METLERLRADHLRSVVLGYRDALRAHQEVINRLNVYPVPDGDTGTNMALTMESVVAELDGATGMTEVCKAISHGSLMGARGNSGVILSQILRGIAKGFEGAPDGAGPEVTAQALTAAADGAYQAVMRPVEGTILTVARAAADCAAGAAPSTLVEALDAARSGAADALARTPDLLPALKQAGVVDAGGAGFLLLLDAFLHVVDGRPFPEAPDASTVSQPAGEARPQAPEHDGVSDLRYEVMYFLEAPDETVPAFREVWAGIGDSIVVVGGDGVWNCHIHTDDIGAAIEAALDAGRPRQIRVTDLIEQVEEERWVREAAPTAAEGGPGVLGNPATTAVVAIATGAGVGRLFRSVGVQAIVAGGQSMNPSTAHILEAVEACPAECVVILPNNKNIVPVAEQVAPLSGKDVRVVPTRSLTEGLAAAFAYDPEGGGDANEDAMRAAVANVVTGELTRAVRDAATDAGPVKEGEYLGLTRSGIAVVAPTLGQAGAGLLDVLVGAQHEIVTILEGEGSSPAATRHMSEWLGEHHPELMVEIHHGGQPLYPYLFSIE
ncbi:MAG: DAK2 domain-containing protein [Acidimicrobiales bacterium]